MKKPRKIDKRAAVEFDASNFAKPVLSLPIGTVANQIFEEVSTNVASIPGSQTRYFETFDARDYTYAERLFDGQAFGRRFLNSECIQGMDKKFFKVLIAQGVFQNQNLKRYLRISIAVASEDLQSSLSKWRNDIHFDPENGYTCSSDNMKNSDPLADEGHFGIDEVKHWLHSKIGPGDKILGLRIEQIVGNGSQGKWDIKHEKTYHIINT